MWLLGGPVLVGEAGVWLLGGPVLVGEAGVWLLGGPVLVGEAGVWRILGGMPTFDVVSRLDLQEVRNAVNQAAREAATRFDFRGTNSSVVLGDGAIAINTVSEERLAALRQVLEEKLVRRKVSLKALDYGKATAAAGARVRQTARLRAGISADMARQINKHIKGLRIKGVQSSTQGDQLRVQSKKRDDLQAVISSLKSADFDLPLQYVNFRS